MTTLTQDCGGWSKSPSKYFDSYYENIEILLTRRNCERLV